MHVQVLIEQASIALLSVWLLIQNFRGKALLCVNRNDTLSDRIEKLTQQLQLQTEPRELVSRRSSQMLLLLIRAHAREGEANGAGLPLRILTDGEGVCIPEEVILDEEGKAEVKVQLLAPDQLYQKGLLHLALVVDDPHGLRNSGSEIEIPKLGVVKLSEIDADNGQILPGK